MNFRVNGKAAGGEESRVGIWGQALWSSVSKTETDLEMRGNVYNLVAGIDRRLSESVLAGVAVGFEDVELVTRFNNGFYRDRGLLLSPYAAWTINSTWTVDASVGYSFLWYDAGRDSGTVKGNFDGSRFSTSSNLTGSFGSGNWRMQPKLGISYSFEHQNAYTDNTQSRVDENAFALGQMTAGGKIGYAFNDWLPYVKGIGEWDWRHPYSVLKANGQQSIVDEFGGSAGIGVEFSSGALTASIEGDYNSVLRRDLDVWAVIGRFRWEY